ncbi:MAG: mechanosensitive ion channel family protein [Mesorhizobium sp.]|nr:mechanosensitive ion channel family protein [Mesorhizobium sp.]MBL8577791.1 mechanosensitive ion channel family protein [Mesorhizobium sp.]
MELDPQNTWIAIQAGVAQVSGLAISYSFSVIGAVILLVAGWIVAGFVERSIFAGLGKVRGFDTTLSRFISTGARYAILIIVIVMVLGQFGVQTASIIAAIGAIGLAIGLALQGTLQNIAAGMMLLFLRPFRIGEAIKVGAIDGTVEEIGLFATRLRAVDGTYILAPNSKLWNEPVYNMNRNGVRRNDITVGIGYGDDIDLAQATMIDLARADRRVSHQPAPVAFVSELGDSAVSITLRYWTNDKDFFSTKLDLTKLAKLTFDRKGISMPFLQQEVVYRGSMPTQ